MIMMMRTKKKKKKKKDRKKKRNGVLEDVFRSAVVCKLKRGSVPNRVAFQ